MQCRPGTLCLVPRSKQAKKMATALQPARQSSATARPSGQRAQARGRPTPSQGATGSWTCSTLDQLCPTTLTCAHIHTHRRRGSHSHAHTWSHTHMQVQTQAQALAVTHTRYLGKPCGCSGSGWLHAQVVPRGYETTMCWAERGGAASPTDPPGPAWPAACTAAGASATPHHGHYV